MVILNDHEYEALLKWAALGAAPGEDTEFAQLRKRVDSSNQITRYTLIIRYEALPQRPAPGISDTPKGETILLELTRPPTREDVDAALAGKLYHAGLVWLSADPRGEVGFYELDAYPWR